MDFRYEVESFSSFQNCVEVFSYMIQRMTKPTKYHVHPAKTQVSLGIHPVWSESSLCTQWVAKNPSFLHEDSEDSGQTWWMLCCDLSLHWANLPFCRFCHALTYVVFSILIHSWVSIHVDAQQLCELYSSGSRTIMGSLKCIRINGNFCRLQNEI